MEVTVAGDGSLSVSSAPVATPLDTSFCGRLYAILALDMLGDIAEVYEYNNVASDVVIVTCDATGD